MRKLILGVLPALALIASPAVGQSRNEVDSLIQVQESVPQENRRATADEPQVEVDHASASDEPASVIPGMIVCVTVGLLGAGLLIGHWLGSSRITRSPRRVLF